MSKKSLKFTATSRHSAQCTRHYSVCMVLGYAVFGNCALFIFYFVVVVTCFVEITNRVNYILFTCNLFVGFMQSLMKGIERGYVVYCGNNQRLGVRWVGIKPRGR